MPGLNRVYGNDRATKAITISLVVSVIVFIIKLSANLYIPDTNIRLANSLELWISEI